MNRVVAAVKTRIPLAQMNVTASSVTAARIDTLRSADAIVRRLSRESGYDREVWQFPVILIPLGSDSARESIVLRPIHSVDGMTAQAVKIPAGLLDTMCARLLELPEIAGVFCDLTHKPPGTIEWE
jgi:GMP synthase (glutamine-hydrolysing)